jgi:adenylate kinase
MAAKANRIILLGGPGAGKGTVASAVVERFGLPHLSTGDILRSAVRAGTEVGRVAKGWMEAGRLVPDEVIIGVLRERVDQADCRDERGDVRYLLDGFPRTLPQADALDAEISLRPEAVVYLAVPDDVIVRRLTGRRTCPSCGASYHVDFAPPRREGECDRCTGRLIIRADDEEKTIRQRLETFHQQTAPLCDRYAPIVIEIDGSGSPAAVQARVVAALEA